MRLLLLLGVLASLLVLLPGPMIAAQGADTCPGLVAEALQALDNACTGLTRNAACYGHNRIDATFWQPRDDLLFSQPADRVALIDLQTLATAPLDIETERWGVAVLNLQADLPDTLPGQAVTMLLMGDTTVTNRVTPEQAAGTVVPVIGATTTGANVRSRPTTASNILMSLRSGTEVTITGLSADRDWYQLLLADGSRGWIYAPLVRVSDGDALNQLPIGDRPRYGPMQAFYFTTGFGAPNCNEAPNAVVIQSNELAEVTLNVNELEIQLGSSIALTMASLNNGTARAMVLVLLEGRVQTRIGGYPIVLTTPGRAIAISVNEQGLVDQRSRLVRLRDVNLNEQLINACQFAANSALFGAALPSGACPRSINYYIPPPPPTAVPTPAGPNINFVADRTTVPPGECANLAWDVSNVQAVYFEGAGVTGQGSRQVCPRVTTPYTLTVVTRSGEQVTRSLTINVSGGYSISFYADKTSMSYTDCATLYWNTSGVQAVYYQNQGVVGNGSAVECPYDTGQYTYELRVILQDGSTEYRYVTIDVT
ncbi:MAG: hypothetical protein Kow0077_21950 [Anaerolineae bacterium]